MSQEDLDAINDSCQGKQYIEKDAATEINGTPLKPELMINNLPFLKFVEIGSGGDGCAQIPSDSPNREQKEEERKIQKILCAIMLTTYYSRDDDAHHMTDVT